MQILVKTMSFVTFSGRPHVDAHALLDRLKTLLLRLPSLLRKPDGTRIPNNAVTGFIRVEPLGGDTDTRTEAGSPVEKEWFQWEIILSR